MQSTVYSLMSIPSAPSIPSFFFFTLFLSLLLPTSLSVVNTISLYAITFDPAICMLIHLDFESSDTLDALWRSQISLSPLWLGFRNRSTEAHHPRIGRDRSADPFKKSKKRRRRRREINKENSGLSTIQWRSTGRQSYFTNARASFALPLMD